jgi:hypothetical protein
MAEAGRSRMLVRGSEAFAHQMVLTTPRPYSRKFVYFSQHSFPFQIHTRQLPCLACRYFVHGTTAPLTAALLARPRSRRLLLVRHGPGSSYLFITPASPPPPFILLAFLNHYPVRYLLPPLQISITTLAPSPSQFYMLHVPAHQMVSTERC